MSRLGDLYKAMETLRKEGLSLNEDLERQVSEVVSVTNQLKFYEPDGKKRLTDVFDNQGVNILAKNVIGLLWLFLNSSPIALMEQLKNVPSKLEGVGIENPCK